MNWEELTAPEFEKAVAECGGVCILPTGVIEKHGDHVPLGMDAINAHEVAERAAAVEPVMVFPFYYFGQNTHAKCEPGAIAIRFELLHPLLESVCDEIARNGFRKIIFYNCHGGNLNLLNYFCEKMLDREKTYMVYQYSPFLGRERDKSIFEAEVDGHGGEFETSVMMAERPELVKGQPADYGMPLKREAPFRKTGAVTPTWWYADYPGMLCADRTICSAEKGERFLAQELEGLIELIRLVKRDDTPLKLYREFMDRCARPTDAS